jgi:hypothetical protein
MSTTKPGSEKQNKTKPKKKKPSKQTNEQKCK